jgi:hypothetical protein
VLAASSPARCVRSRGTLRPRAKKRQRRRPDRARQRADRLQAVQAADVADGAVAVACGLLDGVAQASELGRLAEHPAPVTLLLVGLVRSHRSPNSESQTIRADWCSLHKQQRASPTNVARLSFPGTEPHNCGTPNLMRRCCGAKEERYAAADRVLHNR